MSEQGFETVHVIIAAHMGNGELEKVMHSFPAICSRYFPRSLRLFNKAARSAAWNELFQIEQKPVGN